MTSQNFGRGRGLKPLPEEDFREPTELKALVREALRQQGLSRRKTMRRSASAKSGKSRTLEEVEAVWGELVGSDQAACTQLGFIRRGVLTIEVSSATLLHEFVAYRRRDLLAELQTRLPKAKISDLRFRKRRSRA